MNILILTDPISRPTYAPRLRHLCDYLVEKDHHVEVFTEKWDSITFDHLYPINELPFFHLGYISWAIKTGYTILTNWKDRFFARRVLWKIKERPFDVVMCTTASHFPLTAAYKIAKRRHIKFYVDMREVTELIPEREYAPSEKFFVKPVVDFYTWVFTRRRNRALRHADLITTVSPQHVEILKAINPNVQLVYNGFDPDLCYPSTAVTEAFQINYIGRMYETQDPSLMLKAVKELNLPDVEVNFYSNMSAWDRIQQKGVQIYGFLPTNAIPDTIRRSSVIVILRNTRTNGSREWKFFNALGCEKPVLCIPCDDGLLAHFTELTHAGICTSSLQEVKDFIMTQYQIWKKQGYTHQEVRNKDLFNRLCQAQQIEDLLVHITGV